jgi:hypothetical protein
MQTYAFSLIRAFPAGSPLILEGNLTLPLKYRTYHIRRTQISHRCAVGPIIRQIVLRARAIAPVLLSTV